MLDRCEKTSRRKHVTLEKTPRGDIHLGKSGADISTHATLSFKQIYDICKFDLENVYFTSLGQTLKQTKGVPMGSPASPNMAICICAYYEHKFMQKNKEHKDKMGASRYIDDLCVFFAFDKTKPNTKQLALDLIKDLKNDTYHQDMKLKDEDTTREFNFLPAKINIISKEGFADEIQIKYNNKNFTPLMKSGKLKLRNLQHRDSFITSEQAKAKIIGKLHRIQQVTNNAEYMTEATAEFIMIARTLNYQNSEIITAIKHMIKKIKSIEWVYILHFISLFIKLNWDDQRELLCVHKYT